VTNLAAVQRRTHVPLETLATGFDHSRERLTGARDSDASFHSLFEALAWSGLLYERLSGRHDVVPELKGLWFVRNVVLHQGADVLLRTVLVPGAELGMMKLGQSKLGSVTQWGWKWPPRQLLPEAKSPRGSSEYDARIADHVVRETLEVVSIYLGSLGKIPKVTERNHATTTRAQGEDQA
jgi:hypothetical protein